MKLWKYARPGTGNNSEWIGASGAFIIYYRDGTEGEFYLQLTPLSGRVNQSLIEYCCGHKNISL